MRISFSVGANKGESSVSIVNQRVARLLDQCGYVFNYEKDKWYKRIGDKVVVITHRDILILSLKSFAESEIVNFLRNRERS